ncbi:MAG: M24 family metallopeptidase [Acidimicrobiales bacterium]
MNPPRPSLPAMDRAARRGRAVDAVTAAGVGCLVVTKMVNIRWLTGFTGSAATMVLDADQGRDLFITDGRYADHAAAELDAAGVDAEIVITTTPSETFAAWSAGRRLSVGLEADHLTWAAATTATDQWFPALDVRPTRGVLEGPRELKEPAEIARVEAAAAIADAALAEVVATITPGVTEIEVAIELESAMRRDGAESVAFETIVASGPNSALPHHHPGRRVMVRGDLLVIDMGATVDGYRSDMTRSFVLGDPTEEQLRLLEVVGRAQAAGIAATAAGVACADVDAAARTVIADAGWADAFVHPTGHGVGLEIHEPLRLAATSAATLDAGHVVTVEPGVYLPGTGGVRIEDTVEVVEGGCRPLTRSSLAHVIG